MLISRIVDTLNDTNIYFLIDEKSNNAILIDPSNYDLSREFIEKNKLLIEFVILTHEHFDHILGVNDLSRDYQFKLISSYNCNIGISNPKRNLSSYGEVLFKFKDENVNIKPYVCRNLDVSFLGEMSFYWNEKKIELYETQGHSKGSISIIVENKYLFSGDSLLKDLDVITRFPGGSTKDYINKTFMFYKTLDKNMIVYPGHGESFGLKEKLDEK